MSKLISSLTCLFYKFDSNDNLYFRSDFMSWNVKEHYYNPIGDEILRRYFKSLVLCALQSTSSSFPGKADNLTSRGALLQTGMGFRHFGERDSLRYVRLDESLLQEMKQDFHIELSKNNIRSEYRNRKFALKHKFRLAVTLKASLLDVKLSHTS